MNNRRRRNSLHKTKVDEFIQWVIEHKEYTRQEIKGHHEVFRLLDSKYGDILIGHKRDRTDHITTTGRLTTLVNEWVQFKKAQKKIRNTT